MRVRSMKKRKQRYLLWISIFMILLGLFFFFLWMTPKITLKGKKTITININSIYNEQGAKAYYQGKNISKEIQMDGKINTKKQGTYQVVYSIKKGFFKRKVTRNVIVKDVESPKIELIGDETIYLCPGSTYEELGYKAVDNVDGDLTKKVKIKVEKDQIIYTVQDKSNNKTTLHRKFIYKDIEPPQMILTGGEVFSIPQNTVYEELGYQAMDRCDGDVTKQVKVTGEVNTKQIGTYEIFYEVEDKEGNVQKVKRTVYVVEPQKNGTIYLTFDDGPKQGTTDVILDILKEEGVKATFFVTNGGPDSLIKREADEGHTVALHTASHNYQTVYSSVEGYFNDLQIVHDRVLRITGQDARIIRFPGGSSNTISRRYQPGIMTTLTKEVILRGYRYYDWNISSGDAGETTSSEGVYQNVVRSLSKSRTNMILFHDTKSYTANAIQSIIRYGKNNGYTFAAIEPQTKMVTHSVNN